MTNEPEETTEEVAEEVTDEQGFEALDPVSQLLIERRGTTLVKDEPEPEQEDVPDESAEDTQEEAIPAEPEYLFELDDGTKVTMEMAKSGMMMRADYTRKTQEAAEEKKKNERYSAIINRMENDPALARMVIDYMTGEGPQEQKSRTGKLQVPDSYKGDQFVEKLVEFNNQLSERLEKVEGGVSTITETSTEATKRAEQKALFDARLAEGYEYLKGKVGTPPTPKEFVERIEQYVTEQGLDPQVVGGYIIGGDPDYLRAKIDRAFETDIAATIKDKVNSSEKERKKRVATTQTLRVGGKSKSPVPQSLPKGRDGKLDTRAALLMIQEEQARIARG